MAIFQTTHPKERDVTEKHGITVDEIRFLKKLQHELNIQDSMGNRDPRFWVIRQSKDTLVAQDTEPFDYDYVALSDEDDLSKNVGSLDELFDVIKELAVDGSYQYGVDRAGDGIVVTNEDDGSTFVIRNITEKTAALLNDMAGDTGRFYVNYMAKKRICRTRHVVSHARIMRGTSSEIRV